MHLVRAELTLTLRISSADAMAVPAPHSADELWGGMRIFLEIDLYAALEGSIRHGLPRPTSLLAPFDGKRLAKIHRPLL
jgi:hypothetical protein